MLNDLFEVFLSGIVYLHCKYLGVTVLFKLARRHVTGSIITNFLTHNFFIRIMKTLFWLEWILRRIVGNNDCYYATFLRNDATNLRCTLFVVFRARICHCYCSSRLLGCYLSLNLSILPWDDWILFDWLCLIIDTFQIKRLLLRVRVCLVDQVVVIKLWILLWLWHLVFFCLFQQRWRVLYQRKVWAGSIHYWARGIRFIY